MELTDYLRSVSSIINTRISHTECALVMNELYFDRYAEPVPRSVDLCLGAIVNRRTKEPVIQDIIPKLLRKYVYLDVKSQLGLTFVEYLDTTSIMREQYDEFLEPFAVEKARMAAEQNAAAAAVGDTINEHR